MINAFRQFDMNRNGRLEMNEALMALNVLRNIQPAQGGYGY